MRRTAGWLVVGLIVASCGGEAAETTTTSTASVEPTPDITTTSQAPPPTTTTTAAPASTTTTTAPEPALEDNGGNYEITWANVQGPFWNPSAGSAESPFFFIHTSNELDGFYFSLEMYTTGYGALWTGELGEVQIICNEAPPAPNSTGICPHFDPDGPGPLGDLNADFAATGSITINKLDDSGYDIVVNQIVFSDGSTIEGFQLIGP